MAAFEWINLDWFAIGAPAACVGAVGTRLALKGFVPLGVLGVAVVAAAACRADWRAGARDALSYVLPCLFALVPSVSARIFSAFPCEAFGDDADTTRAYLVADLSMACDTPEHAQLRTLAGALIVLSSKSISVPTAGAHAIPTTASATGRGKCAANSGIMRWVRRGA